MRSVRDRWGDLGVRVTSGVVMLAIAAIAIGAGAFIFSIVVAILAVVGVGELVAMGRSKIKQTGQFTSADLMLSSLYAAIVLFGAFGIISTRLLMGTWAVLVLISLVVVADSAAYFVGRKVGGRKFWPSISPKKTWAGTIGAWAATGFTAVLVGNLLVVGAQTGSVAKAIALFAFGMTVALVSQLGDLFESAIKRRMGVKDSSKLIPGHGGILDRFDAMLAVGCIALLVILYLGQGM